MLTAAPLVPAPKKPIAKPRLRGKNLATYGVPTAKLSRQASGWKKGADGH